MPDLIGSDEITVSAGDYITLVVLQNQTTVAALDLIADVATLRARYVANKADFAGTVYGILIGLA